MGSPPAFALAWAAAWATFRRDGKGTGPSAPALDEDAATMGRLCAPALIPALLQEIPGAAAGLREVPPVLPRPQHGTRHLPHVRTDGRGTGLLLPCRGPIQPGPTLLQRAMGARLVLFENPAPLIRCLQEARKNPFSVLTEQVVAGERPGAAISQLLAKGG
jgi:hypothetical protein